MLTVSGHELRSADVVVVGAGVVGASAAYHLTAAGAGSVLLLESADAVGTGSTGLCAGGFRHQFSSAINIELSQRSIELITSFSDTHGLPLDIHRDGYLFLVRDESAWPAFESDAALQRRMGVDTQLLDAAAAAELIPGLRVDDVVGATYCADDGIVDPYGLTQGYVTAARRRGVMLSLRTRAERILTRDGRVAGVETSAGPVATGTVVNAAGAWARDLAETAGIDLPVQPLPRHIVVTSPFPGRPERRTLVVDTPTGCYFHREGDGVLMGMGAPAERYTFDTRADEGFIAEQLVPAAMGMLPAFEEAGLVHRWAGLYEMTPDHHPIIGPAPSVSGCYLANGFSGHGFQQGPIVGKLLAEQICAGGARTVDISALGLERFAEGRLIEEQHVI